MKNKPSSASSSASSSATSSATTSKTSKPIINHLYDFVDERNRRISILAPSIKKAAQALADRYNCWVSY